MARSRFRSPDIGSTIANITFGGNLVGVRNSGTTLATIGGATNIPQGRLVRVYQFADTLSWSRVGIVW